MIKVYVKYQGGWPQDITPRNCQTWEDAQEFIAKMKEWSILEGDEIYATKTRDEREEY